MNAREINRYILDNYLKKSDKEMSDYLRKKGNVLSPQAIRKRRETRGLVKGKDWGSAYQRSQAYGEEVSFDDEAKKLQELKEGKDKDKRYQRLLIEHKELREQLEATKHIGEVKAKPIPKPKGGKGEATLVALLSDWHIEEHVTRESTNGRNEYNLELSKKRSEYYFTTLLKLIEIEQKSIPVKRLVVALLGDFFTGNIHEEAIETNLLGTTPAVRRAEEYLLSGIQYLLDNSKLEFTMICHSGNHARITKKQRHGNEHAASLEYLMYHNMASYFRNEPRVEFIIPEAYHSYMTIYDTVLRFHHGHNIRYAGGIGGITTPVVKAINPWNTVRHANVDCVDEETEILSVNGFKKIGEIQEQDAILNLNMESGKIEEDVALRVVEREHHGEMVLFENENFSMQVTPNHRVLFAWPQGISKDVLKVKTAEEIAKLSSEIKIPLAGDVADGQSISISDDMVALVGWLISEGCFSGPCIRIGQRDAEKVAKIRQAIRGSGVRYSENVRSDGITMFNIHKAWRPFIERFVESKSIPEWVKFLTKRQFDIFLDAMVDGDGNWIGKWGTGSYYSKSEAIIDELQIGLTLHGFRSYKYYKKGGFKDGCWVLGLCERSTSNYTLHRHKAEKVAYNGRVWCLTTNNGTLICRRKGKVFITGNCFGHFHQAFDGGRFIANGSMIGFNGYAVAIKADYQPPCQVLFGIHSELQVAKYLTRYISFPF